MKRFILPLILVVAFVLRVTWLDKYPAGFTPDEASFGYDAYSILKTGNDQWGHTLPIVLESFGDFKSPLYAYLTIPSVAIFGLSKFAVRLPNALLGTLAVLVVYLLTKELFKDKKLAVVAALMLAISPWHIMLSRGAFEANLTTFFLPLGILLFLKERYTLSAIILGLNLFTYHSAKLVTPLIVGFMVFLYRDRLKGEIKKVWIGAVVFLASLTLIGYSLVQGAGARASERSIAQGALEEAFSQRVRSGTLFHNKYIVIAERFLGNYVTYLSPQFFFSEGPREGTYGMIPGRGVLYWFVIPFFLGVRKLFFQGRYRKELLFLFSWILLSPIPASLATGVGYHANRVATMMPALEILLGVGVIATYDWIKKRKILLWGFSALVLMSLILFLEDYFVQSPYKIAKPMLYGNLEMGEWLTKNAKGKNVIVDRGLSEPHIYIAFSQKWDPIDYQKQTAVWNYREKGVNWVDQLSQYQLGNYTFKNIEWQSDIRRENSYLVGKPEDFPSDVFPLIRIFYPDKTDSYWVVDMEKYSKI